MKSCHCIIPASKLSCAGYQNEETNDLIYQVPMDDFEKAREYDRLVKFFSQKKYEAEDKPYVEVK